ncbi:MAG TPA: hypothetical protein ENK35_06180 [Candidatus Tenderia sp.]|nr:hypothetical protein [Candidatus Tenderia sp.]
MSRLSLLVFTLAVFSTPGWGGALDKYAPPGPAQQAVPYQNAPKQRAAKQIDRTSVVTEKQRQALETLRSLPPETQKRWISEFKTKAAQAAKQGQYGAAAYYQGIIEAWTLENQ